MEIFTDIKTGIGRGSYVYPPMVKKIESLTGQVKIFLYPFKSKMEGDRPSSIDLYICQNENFSADVIHYVINIDPLDNLVDFEILTKSFLKSNGQTYVKIRYQVENTIWSIFSSTTSFYFTGQPFVWFGFNSEDKGFKTTLSEEGGFFFNETAGE